MLTAAAVLACGSDPIALEEAKRLVLAAPDIRASVVEQNAHPFFEDITREGVGWRFLVKARNPCSGPSPCSNLLGHYMVAMRTAEVEDLDGGEDGQIVTSPELTIMQHQFLTRRCR
jgi:hypothetical protein